MRKWLVVSAVSTVVAASITLSPRTAAAQPPVNDDFDAAIAVALPTADTRNTREATTAVDDPNCSGNGHTVWYRFTPTADVLVATNTFGSNYDTTLSVWTGARGALNLIACNDDSGSLQSRLLFQASAGVTYYIMAASFDSLDGGDLVFSIDVAPPPPTVIFSIDPIDQVTPSNGQVTLSGSVTCSRPLQVSVFGSLQQKRGRDVVAGVPNAFFECNGTMRWTAPVAYSPVLFHGRSALLFTAGQAQAQVFMFGFDPSTGESTQSGTARQVNLRP